MSFENIIQEFMNDFSMQVIDHFNGEIKSVKRSLLTILSLLEREKFLHSLSEDDRNLLCAAWVKLSDENLEKLSTSFAIIADNFLEKQLNYYGIKQAIKKSDE